MFSFAWSAIVGGHMARKARKKIKVTARSWKERNEMVLSDTKVDSTKAENWIAYWGNKGRKGAWRNGALGAGE